MKQRFIKHFKLNIMSIFFIAVSFISITLAWFAYSGVARGTLDVGVKAWYIELSKDGQAVTNNIVITLSEIYPGMDTVNEVVNIKNLGDSDADVRYSIASARILGEAKDNYIVDDINVLSEYVEDVISHNYPFHVNINIDKDYVVSKTGEVSFKVSVSWPLDSGNDSYDSEWGTQAYLFQQNEQNLKNQNSNYQIRPAIQIVINIMAEQYLATNASSDMKYNAGDIILYDVVNNQRCTSLSETCLKTYVIDENNTLGDSTVTLLPNPTSTYLSGTYNDYDTLLSSYTSGWNVATRSLTIDDVLKLVSTDILSSVLVRENISDMIIGDLAYNNRMTTEINKAIVANGYYKYDNAFINYLSSVNCYWTYTEYNTDNAFAVKEIDDTNSKIYNELKTTNCNIIPVIIASKSNLE